MANKNILVLARRDHGEGMRVAAGLTITGHAVRLVMMTGLVAETAENAGLAELLELSDIVPETTVPEMAAEMALLDEAGLAAAIAGSDFTVNL